MLSLNFIICKLSGKPPFDGRNDQEVIQAVRSAPLYFDPKYFSSVSAEAINFISSCLNRNYKQRPDAAQLLLHQWFSVDPDTNNSDCCISEDIIDRFRLFQKRSRFNKIVMEVIAHSLSAEQIFDLRREFAKLDKLGTGVISCTSLRQVLVENSSLLDEDINHIFEGIDIDKSNNIEYHEFIAATISRKQITDANLKAAFEKLSRHNDGISDSDLQDLLGENEYLGTVDEILKEEDLSPSNKISFDQVFKPQ
jgi:calcium-dependent protein kinase